MAEELVATLQSHIKELELQIESKNKEIDNLKKLIYNIQDTQKTKS